MSKMPELKVHFLNVGHGDCVIVSHPSGRVSVIDINNGCVLDDNSFNELAAYYPLELSKFIRASLAKEERSTVLIEKGYDIKLTNPIEFLKANYPNSRIWRYIQTHPHMDHMRGLAALRQEGISIDHLWDTRHKFVPNLQQADRADWEEYELLRNNSGEANVLRLNRGAEGEFYNRDPAGVPPGDGIEILHPPAGSNSSAGPDENPNNLSYILRLEYAGVVFILGGDAEEEVWKEVAKNCPGKLKCHVLKASHHGRDSGYCEDAVKLMKPQYTVVSVGKKPDSDASNKYRKHSENVWSTRWRGNITVTVDQFGNGNVVSEYDR